MSSSVDNLNNAPYCELISPLPKLRIEVSDTGCGISYEGQRKIFERFFRVENDVHTEVGTGLGLSIVREIIEKHGSEVRMVSVPEIGTTFWFDLPLSQNDADELLIESERASRQWDKELEQEVK